MSSRYSKISNVKDLEKALTDIKKRRDHVEYKLSGRYYKVQSFFNPVSSFTGFIGGHSGEFLGGFYLISTIARRLLRKKKK